MKRGGVIVMTISELYISAGTWGDWEFRRFMEWIVMKQNLASWHDSDEKLLEVVGDKVMEKWRKERPE